MDKYKKIMCKYKINSREEARKFIVKNHPDKGSGFNQSDFKIILLAKLSALVTGDPSSLISVSKESESYTSIITFEASITVSFKDGRILLMKSWSMIMLKLRF